jgi:hypothetical protein
VGSERWEVKGGKWKVESGRWKVGGGNGYCIHELLTYYAFFFKEAINLCMYSFCKDK